MMTSQMQCRVLLVCMGNICRSPTAEVVLRHFIAVNGIGNKVEVDSAATHRYHVGEAADARTMRAASLRGYDLSQHRARKVACQDLDYFDLILAMDKTILDNLRRMASPGQQAKIRLFMDYSVHFDDDEVPDPYFGLGHSFDLMLDMIEDAAQGLVTEIKKTISGKSCS